jgi:hypothetical protein
MCFVIALFYKLLEKYHKKDRTFGAMGSADTEEDKLHELFVIEENIDQKMIELINDVHKWKNSLRKFPLRKKQNQLLEKANSCVTISNLYFFVTNKFLADKAFQA